MIRRTLMVLAGATVDIGCFRRERTPDFHDRFSLIDEIPRFAPGTLSFSVELGIREAFGCHHILRAAISGFRKALIPVKLYTTGVHFQRRERTCSQVEDLHSAGLQHILLRLDEHEARALDLHCVRNLVEACHAAGVVLCLQLELRDGFPEDCLRIARTLEDRQFTVTVLPVRIRPVLRVTLAEAPMLRAIGRVQLGIDSAGEVTLRKQAQKEVIVLRLGNASDRSITELMAPAQKGD